MDKYHIVKFVRETKLYLAKISAEKGLIMFVPDEKDACSLPCIETARAAAEFVSKNQKGDQIVMGTVKLCKELSWKKLLILQGFTGRNN
jgi:hypothetical protein